MTPRNAAASKGATFYTGKACVYGHPSGRRYVSTGACAACVTEKDRARRSSGDSFDALLSVSTQC